MAAALSPTGTTSAAAFPPGAEWLSDILGRSGVLREGAVAEVESEFMAEGVGFTGRMARLHLRYAGPADGAPASLIAKSSSADPAVRALIKGLGLYEREVRFYRELAVVSGVRTPRCYFAGYDPETAECLLLLEDLRAARPGDNLAGCGRGDAELILRELAMFHAAWWEHPQLPALSWVPRFDDGLEAMQGNYARGWPAFRQKFDRFLPPRLTEIGERFGRQTSAVRRVLARGTQTLVHNDFRLDNLFLGLPDAPLAVIDWQLLLRGPGPVDVAYFLCWCLRMEERAAELDLLETYHRALTAHGVRDYSFEACHCEFRWGTLNAMLRLVVAGGLLDFSSARGAALARAVFERTLAAMEANRVDELMTE